VNGDDTNEAAVVPAEMPGEFEAPRELLPGDVRRRLVAQFEQWLDRMAAGEPAPEGLPAEILADVQAQSPTSGLESDLYTVFSALTTLSGEIRLQGRAFKQLADALAPLSQLPGKFERLEIAQASVAEELTAALSAEPEAETEPTGLPPAREVLAVVFDLYDRLERGLRTFDASLDTLKQEAATAGLMRRLLGTKTLAQGLLGSAAAIREGYQLTLSRLDGALRQWGVQRVGTVGETFDPAKMNVIEVQPDPARPDGAVIEVFRSGYLLHGNLLSTAQVKVCRNT
jgi:molecular chaperone GrpE